MPSYKDTLNKTQLEHVGIIISTCKSMGITNRFAIGGILAVISKESELNPKASEISYANTSNDRIRKIFTRTQKLTDVQLNDLKKNKDAFFDYVYDFIAGNEQGEGHIFLGKGFNQVTGESNYENIAKLTGIPFDKNPDLLLDPNNAAKASVAYFNNGILTLKKLGKLSWYNATSINDFKNITDATKAIYHVNAGAGHDKAHLDADVTGGRKKALDRMESLLTLVP
jgi:predicted chitinase